MQHEGANKGILVTTSKYGPDAFAFAKTKPVELIDGGNLLYLLQQHVFRARIVMPTATGSLVAPCRRNPLLRHLAKIAILHVLPELE